MSMPYILVLVVDLCNYIDHITIAGNATSG